MQLFRLVRRNSLDGKQDASSLTYMSTTRVKLLTQRTCPGRRASAEAQGALSSRTGTAASGSRLGHPAEARAKPPAMNHGARS
jgi:hypothetical protein